MLIISWNVNGLRAVMKKGFMEWFEEAEPEVLCLQETKLQKDQLPKELIKPFGYHSYWAHAGKKGYSGVALFVKGKAPQVTPGLGIERFDAEGRTLVADFGPFVLINSYFPNGGQGPERLKYKLDYYAAMLDFVQGLREENKSVIMTGDFNTAHAEVDLANPASNREKSGFMDIERKWLDRYSEAGYVDTFRQMYEDEVAYTWWDYRTKARERNSGWRIDYFWVDEAFVEQVGDSYMLSDVIGSDHCPIALDIDIESED